MVEAIIDFSKLSQAEFIKKVNFIIFCCTGNPYVTVFKVSISQISTKLTNYLQKLALAEQGNHLAVDEAITIRKNLSADLKTNGLDITQQTNNDRTKIESTGYDTSKERTAAEKPEVEVLESDQSGAGKVVIKAQEDAVSYLAWHTDTLPETWNDESKWTRLPGSSKHYMWITGVDITKDHYLMYCTITTGGETPMHGPFKFRLR